MYVHAYQSYVWNAIASERLARFGHTPVAGDLVFDIPAKWKAGEAPRKESSNGDGGDPEGTPSLVTTLVLSTEVICLTRSYGH
jgi:tRNA(Glu) U13 pseudouridine synthase TruD